MPSGCISRFAPARRECRNLDAGMVEAGMRVRQTLAQVHDMYGFPNAWSTILSLTRQTRGSYSHAAFRDSRPEVPYHNSSHRPFRGEFLPFSRLRDSPLGDAFVTRRMTDVERCGIRTLER